MVVRLVIGLLLTVAAFAVAGRRVLWLSKLIRTGQPAPGRLDGAPARLRAEVAEVFGQRKLLKWSVPGVAHFLTFWGFVVLALTIIGEHPGLTGRDLSGAIGITEAAGSGLVRTLMADHLVLDVAPTGSGNRRRLQLSDAGEDLLHRSSEALGESFDALVAGLDIDPGALAETVHTITTALKADSR